MSKVVVPEVKASVQEDIAEVLRPLKETVDRWSGVRPGLKPIALLGPTSSLAETINKVNEIITRLQS